MARTRASLTPAQRAALQVQLAAAQAQQAADDARTAKKGRVHLWRHVRAFAMFSKRLEEHGLLAPGIGTALALPQCSPDTLVLDAHEDMHLVLALLDANPTMRVPPDVASAIENMGLRPHYFGDDGDSGDAGKGDGADGGDSGDAGKGDEEGGKGDDADEEGGGDEEGGKGGGADRGADGGKGDKGAGGAHPLLCHRSRRTHDQLRGNIAWLLDEQKKLAPTDADYTAVMQEVIKVYATHRGAGEHADFGADAAGGGAGGNEDAGAGGGSGGLRKRARK